MKNKDILERASRQRRRKILTALITAMVLSAASIAAFLWLRGQPGVESGEPVKPPTERSQQREREFGAWVIYWDQDTVIEELLAFGDSLKYISHFSILFDEYGNMSIPENTLQLHRQLLENPLPSAPRHYLTLVNDVVFDDGRPSLLKDRAVMELLFATPESRARHIGDILHLVEQYGFDAVELDYETLHRQDGLAEKFAVFSFELWEVLEPLGIPLRIVLEPSFPVDRIELPEGPCYSVMFYNLYGHGTGPGPKADADFIRRTAEKMQALPISSGELIFAFATGGFVWTEGSTTVQAVTETQSWDMLAESDSPLYRDAESGALFFSFINQEGLQSTVWFADGHTLDFWMDIAQEDGMSYRFDIWRISNNRVASIGAFMHSQEIS